MPPLAVSGLLVPPPGRIGLDYTPAGAEYLATGGLAPYSWALVPGATPPPSGLTASPAVGVSTKLSGVIADACGTYSFLVRVTDSLLATADLPVDLFVASLPNGLDLLKRLPFETVKGCTVDSLNAVARSALAMISQWTGCPMNPDTCGVPLFEDEVVPTKSFTRRAIPRAHPVTEIVAAFWGTSSLRVGTMRAVQSGSADIAINQDGGSFWLYTIPRADGYSSLFVTYRGGFDVLPPDLVEVFVYLSNLMFKERDRVGIAKLAVGESNTEYFRELPFALQGAINNNRRVLVLV